MNILQFAIARECQRLAERSVAGEEIQPGAYLPLHEAVHRIAHVDCSTGLMDAVAANLRNRPAPAAPEPIPVCACLHLKTAHGEIGCRRRGCACVVFVPPSC